MNYKDNTVAHAGDDVVGVDAKGAEVRGKVIIAHRYFAVASGGKLIGELDSTKFSVVPHTPHVHAEASIPAE